MPIGISPLPAMESSANWPALYENFSSSSGFKKTNLNVLRLLSSVSVIISSMRTGYGKYGFCTVFPLFLSLYWAGS